MDWNLTDTHTMNTVTPPSRVRVQELSFGDSPNLEGLPSENIARRANDQLGYAIASQARVDRAAKCKKPLQYALSTAGISVFKNEDVQAYMTQMAQANIDHQGKAACESTMRLGMRRRNFTLMWLIAAAIISFSIWGYARNGSRLDQYAGMAGVVSAALTFISWAIFSIPSRAWTDYRTATWQDIPIEGYRGEIPAFALEPAMEIRARAPNAQLIVVQLFVGTQDEIAKRIGEADPFLKAVLGDEEFYFEAWDEPKFTAKRLGV